MRYFSVLSIRVYFPTARNPIFEKMDVQDKSWTPDKMAEMKAIFFIFIALKSRKICIFFEKGEFESQ
ncbi:MAG: hypothetical protein DRR08_25505 [Candidatus Parabeggiatoa sp. nov. 2]|nr:MAG: hypothetical protein DRR08_25505 [Gammaproteobacteria bacterium]